MKKYSKKIIMDYINGEDIDGYDLTELEDDVDFMMLVIIECNDKNMYNMCGDNLKRNFNFIKFLIKKFHDDKDFILMIGQEYMSHCDELEAIELKIMICDYLNVGVFDEFMEYRISLDMFYIKQRLICESCIEQLSNVFYKKVNSLGFDIILDEYNHSDVIKNFFAKKMLNEIFNLSDLDFEKMIHLKFKNKEELYDMGINNFLIKHIYLHDEFLSGYVSVHVNLLLNLNKRITKYLERWDKYEMIKNHEKMEILLEEIDMFINENMYFIGMELELLKYILVKFHLEKVFLNSGIGLNYFDEKFRGTYDEINVLNINKLRFEMLRKFMEFISRIEEVCYFGTVPDDYLKDVKKNNMNKGKILKLEMKNSK